MSGFITFEIQNSLVGCLFENPMHPPAPNVVACSDFDLKTWCIFWIAAVIYNDHSLYVWDVRSYSKVS